MLIYLPMWRRVILFVGVVLMLIGSVADVVQGTTRLASPWSAALITVLYCAVLAALAESENRHVRTTERAKLVWRDVVSRCEAETDPMRREFFRGSANGLAAFLAIDGRVPISSIVHTELPTIKPSAEELAA